MQTRFFAGFDRAEDDDDETGHELLFDDEGLATRTSHEQQHTEQSVLRLLRHGRVGAPTLQRDEHITYLLSALEGLSPSFAGLDSSKPWLCYWIWHALDLLGEPISPRLALRTVGFLRHCQDPRGGFCGGPQQLPHLAPTYASVLTLATLGHEDGWRMVDRRALLRWLLSLKRPDGSFAMHLDGEADVRATYCALAVATALDVATPELRAGAAEFVARCQTHEGGFAGVPGNEAHGGYTFCAVAAAALLGALGAVDAEAALEWAARRQMRLEGGFAGRANKLVDSCYSFWVGAVPVMLHRQRAGAAAAGVEVLDADISRGDYVFDQFGLQEYLLHCCQNPRGTGGMCDKPGKSADLYHTCYALSGLSLAQHNPDPLAGHSVLGSAANRLRRTDPVYNVTEGKMQRMIAFFRSLPLE